MERREDFQNSSKLFIRVDKSMHKKLKLLAVMEEKSMTKLVEDILRKHLKSNPISLSD